MRGALAPLLCVVLTACDAYQSVADSTNGAFEPDIAVSTDAVAVVWNDNRHGNDDLYLRLYSPALVPLGAALRLTNTSQPDYEASAAWLGDRLAVAWYQRYPGGRVGVWLGLWDRQGERLWQRQLSRADHSARIPTVLAMEDRLFVAWVEDGSDTTAASALRSTLVDAKGRFDEPRVLAEASRTTWNLNAERWPDGRVAVVFDAVTGTRSNELQLVLTDSRTVDAHRLTSDDGIASKYPDLAIQGTRAALTWFDEQDGNSEVQLMLFDVPAVPSALRAEQVLRVTHTAGNSIGAYLAWNDTTLALAWNDNTTGQHEMFLQRFAADGTALTPARQLTYTAANSMIPSIEALGAGFVLAWNEVVLGNEASAAHRAATKSDIVLQFDAE